MSLGTRLRDLRVVGGYGTQQTLAEALGVSQSTVANWERCRREPDLTSIVRLAETLQVSADYLLELSDDPRGGSASEAQVRRVLFGSTPSLTEEELEDLWEDVREYAHLRLRQHLRERARARAAGPDGPENERGEAGWTTPRNR